jgi:hypothetical protein
MPSKVAIITACWKRPEVFRLFCQWVAQLKPRPQVVCAGSPRDGCEAIAREHGLTYEQVPNEMARKWNHAVGMAQQTDATHFLFMGADDFMDQAMWDYYQRFEGEHLGLLDLLFYDRPSGRAAYWPGYSNRRTGEPIGACKLVRRDVLEKLHWAPFDPALRHWHKQEPPLGDQPGARRRKLGRQARATVADAADGRTGEAFDCVGGQLLHDGAGAVLPDLGQAERRARLCRL